MSVAIHKATKPSDKKHLLLLIHSRTPVSGLGLSSQEADYIRTCQKKARPGKNFFTVNQYRRWVMVHVLDDTKKAGYNDRETFRRAGHAAQRFMSRKGLESVTLQSMLTDKSVLLAYTEGMALGSYRFLKYFSDKEKRKHSLQEIGVFHPKIQASEVEEIRIRCEAVALARDLVNEPNSYLTATRFAEAMQKAGKQAGFKVEVFNKKRIEALKMGGILAVNQGSPEPPTFTIMEWKPKGAKNKQPIVLVGKGVVFDTGGLSLKPTPDSMDHMKCDMGGGAAVTGAMYGIARMKLPVHVIALVPSTDNRPGGNAYVPGDVVRMYDGSTVEVLNTDAEGRLLLADALAYAKRYKPLVTIDVATLTGAAMRAIGIHGVVAMGTAGKAQMEKLRHAGEGSFERLVEFPLWEDYADDIRSGIADVKNIGGPMAGAITAGKFLERFTDYPWIHLDIAGTAFLKEAHHYKGPGGTGSGSRLLIDFVKSFGGK